MKKLFYFFIIALSIMVITTLYKLSIKNTHNNKNAILFQKYKNQLTKNNPSKQESLNIAQEIATLPIDVCPKNIVSSLQQMDDGQKIINALFYNDYTNIITLKDDIDSTQKDILEKIWNNEITSDQFIHIPASTIDILHPIYLQKIVDLQWALFKYLLITHQDFSTGSMTIIDKEAKIMNFLEKYVILMDHYYNQSGKTIRSIFNGYAYNRSGMTTHWYGNQIATLPNGVERIYGINVKKNGIYHKNLPTNKDQLHFAQLKNGAIFIKWEEYGTTLSLFDWSLLWHCLTLWQTKKEHQNNIDVPFSRKESQIPNNVQKKIQDLLENYSIDENQKKLIQAQGIAEYRKLFLEISPQKAAEFDTFLRTVKNYDQATLSYRKGDEVILNFNTMQTYFA